MKLKILVKLRMLCEVIVLLFREVRKLPLFLKHIAARVRLFCSATRRLGYVFVGTCRTMPALFKVGCLLAWEKQIELVALSKILYAHISLMPQQLLDQFNSTYAVSTFRTKQTEWRKIHAQNLAISPRLHKDELRGFYIRYWAYELWQIVRVYRVFLREHFKAGEFLDYFVDKKNHIQWRRFWVRKLRLRRRPLVAWFVFFFMKFFGVIVFLYFQCIGQLIVWTVYRWFVCYGPWFFFKRLTFFIYLSLNLGTTTTGLIVTWRISDRWPDTNSDYLWENVYPVDKVKQPHAYKGTKLVFRRLCLFSALSWLFFGWLCYYFRPLIVFDMFRIKCYCVSMP